MVICQRQVANDDDDHDHDNLQTVVVISDDDDMRKIDFFRYYRHCHH